MTKQLPPSKPEEPDSEEILEGEFVEEAETPPLQSKNDRYIETLQMTKTVLEQRLAHSIQETKRMEKLVELEKLRLERMQKQNEKQQPKGTTS